VNLLINTLPQDRAVRGDSSDDDDENYNDNNADENDELFASSKALLGDSSSRLQPGYLNIIRCKDANQHDPSKSVVKSVSFHSSGELLLTAGLDKTLRFFQVDGLVNAKVHGIHFKDLPIHCAAFTANDQVSVINCCYSSESILYSSRVPYPNSC
jgi:U3 small nucleolar RNA-associated protein 18